MSKPEEYFLKAKSILAAATEAAKRVAEWGEILDVLISSNEAYANALKEVVIQEESELSYRSARCIEDDLDEHQGMFPQIRPNTSLTIEARKVVSKAFQKKLASEAYALQAKSRAIAALDRANHLLDCLESE